MIDMGLISENITVDSVRIINGMKLNQKVAMCDKIHSEQPYIFQELLLLSHTDIPLAKMEHLYHLLMVIHTAFKTVMSDSLKIIETRDIDEVVKKNKQMFNLFEFEPDTKAMKLSIESYPEQWLIAYVLDYLIRHEIKGQTEENGKVVFMAKVILDSYIHVCKRP